MKRVEQIGVVVGLQVAGTVEDDEDARVAGASCDLLRLAVAFGRRCGWRVNRTA